MLRRFQRRGEMRVGAHLPPELAETPDSLVGFQGALLAGKSHSRDLQRHRAYIFKRKGTEPLGHDPKS